MSADQWQPYWTFVKILKCQQMFCNKLCCDITIRLVTINFQNVYLILLHPVLYRGVIPSVTGFLSEFQEYHFICDTPRPHILMVDMLSLWQRNSAFSGGSDSIIWTHFKFAKRCVRATLGFHLIRGHCTRDNGSLWESHTRPPMGS
jgi:hypothetical protein